MFSKNLLTQFCYKQSLQILEEIERIARRKNSSFFLRKIYNLKAVVLTFMGKGGPA